MGLIILPIVSLVLYLVGFFIPNLVLYMAVAGLAVAVLSYNACVRSDQKNAKYFSLALIILGVVLLLCSIFSILVIGPFLSSIL
jgi:hypothetical protein